ncbi:DUF5989 family protein [Dolichospermum circinale]|uniref:DUF5989 family protein n=1 Tax=Dolichospermum circinale TaxID=109265 RepID=UPI003A926716
MFETTQDFLKDLWGFLKDRQKFFLLPLIVTLLLLAFNMTLPWVVLLIIFGQLKLWLLST